MKQIKYSILMLFVIFNGCLNKPDKDESTENQAPTADNSQTALDWSGTYKGVLPCADCQGIETLIRLNEDYSYTKKVKYLGKEDKYTTMQGKFSWDDTGNMITLEEDKPNAYRVGENQLFALDINNERITGDLQDLYVLKKLKLEDQLIEGYWKLESLNGGVLEFSENNGQEAHIILKEQDSLLVGSGGCNRLRGSYKLNTSSKQLSFKQISTTMKACDKLKTESRFLKVLESVAQYDIKNDSLILYSEDKTQSASFILNESL